MNRSEPGSGPGNVERNKPMMGLLEHVQNATSVNSLVAAADTVLAVFASLLLAVDVKAAQRFVAGMPPTLKTMLHGFAHDRRSAPAIADVNQAVERIAIELRCDADRARKLAIDVVAGAAVWLPRDELTELKRQLPAEFSQLFRHLT